MNESNTSTSFASAHSGSLLFTAIAAAIFAAIYLAYDSFFVGTIPFLKYLEIYGTAASQLLSQLGVSHEFVAVIQETELKNVDVSRVIRNTIKNDDLAAKVLITDGTDARIIFAMLVAGILAWPGAAGKKIIALLIGLAVVFSLNVLRIAGMFLVDVHMPLQFALFKDAIFPVGMICLTLLYFMFWIKWSGRHPDISNT